MMMVNEFEGVTIIGLLLLFCMLLFGQRRPRRKHREQKEAVGIEMTDIGPRRHSRLEKNHYEETIVHLYSPPSFF
jgi:hypothetical protein